MHVRPGQRANGDGEEGPFASPARLWNRALILVAMLEQSRRASILVTKHLNRGAERPRDSQHQQHPQPHQQHRHKTTKLSTSPHPRRHQQHLLCGAFPNGTPFAGRYKAIRMASVLGPPPCKTLSRCKAFLFGALPTAAISRGRHMHRRLLFRRNPAHHKASRHNRDAVLFSKTSVFAVKLTNAANLQSTTVSTLTKLDPVFFSTILLLRKPAEASLQDFCRGQRLPRTHGSLRDLCRRSAALGTEPSLLH